MTELVVVCEGQTEAAFVRQVLQAPLAAGNLFVQPRLIQTSPGTKGGALSRRRVLRALRNLLRGRPDVCVTTFFDLYALPPDFPGRSRASTPADPLIRAAAIESAFHHAVVEEADCRPDRFFPHIQPCEFESLLFSDVTKFGEAEPDWMAFVGDLQEARRSARSPEHVNDGIDTHPSARLRKLRPRYGKVRHGVAVSARIGLGRMRAECGHFARWLTRVENLTRPAPGQ